jgi:type I restriction enzyme S subunit
MAPLPEQHRIVAEIERHFTRLDAAVASLQRARANLKRYRASVLKTACEGRLVPTEAELARQEGRDYQPASVLLERILKERRAHWDAQPGRHGKYQEPQPPDSSPLPPLPEGWAWTTLGQISDIQGGIQKQPKRTPRNNAFPFLRVANVFRGRLDLSEIHSIELFEGELGKLRLEPGDLLIVEGNGSVSEIGRMAIWDGSVQNCVHQNHIIRARMLGGLLPQFASAYWNSPEGTVRVMRVAASTSGLYTLSVSKVSVLPLPLPPLAEQQRIVSEVERHLSVIEAAENVVDANLKRAERLRQSILQRAFQGKLVPQDPTDEPASALLERIRAERGSMVADKPRRQERPRRPDPC